MMQKQTGRLLKFGETQGLLLFLTSRERLILCQVMLPAAFLLVLCGCGKKETAQADAPATAGASSSPVAVAPGAPAPMGPLPTVAVAPQGGADLKDLNHAYIRWVVQSHRHAKTFEEFAGASGISVPPPPPGKKYVIDKVGFINLADK